MASAASSGNLPPPSYTEKSDPRSELPAYGQIHHSDPALHTVAQNVTKEFDYTIAKGGHPFLVMTLITTGPHLQDTPIFVEGSPVKGKIQLHLKKPDSISSVALTVKGLMLTGTSYANDTPYASHGSVFFDQTHAVWTQEEPHTTLHGEYTWPFAIDLPEEVEIADESHNQPKTFRLPQTFFERFIRATSIRYEIIVTVVRKGILHSNDSLSTPFAYIPVVQPPPLPPLRRLAYEKGTPILGPKVDPDGWYLPKPVQIEGSLFNDHSVRAECRLFLANPLSYTRGSVIPLVMTLESDNSQLLDLLSSPEAISVRTRRHISAYHGKPLGERPLYRIDHSQRAVWWRQTEDQTDRLRVLHGEIHLRPDMVPTSAMRDFSVNYTVVLFPFDVPGFKIKSEDIHDHSLLQQPINIVTAFAPGPRPRMSTPVDYTPNDKMDDVDNLEKNDALTTANDFYLSGDHD